VVDRELEEEGGRRTRRDIENEEEVMQHNVVEEQLQLAATTWTSQISKKPLQRVVLDIALGVLR
jgi:hypothetical protein